MNATERTQLHTELKAVGAEDTEISNLLPIADMVGRIKNESRLSVQPAQPVWRRLVRTVSFPLAGLVAGVALVVVSQTVLPTSWLYPVQRASDHIAIEVDPGYQATVMMRRAYQVNQLVARQASGAVVLGTLSDYTSQATSYKATQHANYAAFDYCERSLSQAAKVAPPDQRRAITSSLQTVEGS